MTPQRSQFAIKLLPSLTDFAFLMPIAFLFGRMEGVKTLLSDCDTGWHIRTGKWILAHGWVPTRDLFSFSRPGEPWFAWEWLSDVLFAKLNSAGGLQAVVLFSILLVSVTFMLLYLVARRKANALVSIAVTMLAAAASSIHWLARPHLFTLLFLVLFYAALERVREGRTRLGGVPYLAILPVATILWTNLLGSSRRFVISRSPPQAAGTVRFPGASSSLRRLSGDRTRNLSAADNHPLPEAVVNDRKKMIWPIRRVEHVLTPINDKI